MVKCRSCSTKTGERNCPDLGGLICPTCCDTERRIKIECSSECFYLDKSRGYSADRREAAKLDDFEREMKAIIWEEASFDDIIQRIELVIWKTYKEQRDIVDRHVETALDYMMEMGKAQLDIPTKSMVKPPPRVRAIIDRVDGILGFRESLTGKPEDLIAKLKCIYRVLSSVRIQYEPDDDCSYLDFIGLLGMGLETDSD